MANLFITYLLGAEASFRLAVDPLICSVSLPVKVESSIEIEVVANPMNRTSDANCAYWVVRIISWV